MRSGTGAAFRQVQAATRGDATETRPAKGSSLPDASIWSTPLVDPSMEAGRVVWTGTCIDCHSTGLGGAPLIGNKALWAPRLEKGLETLVSHAIGGFYGDVGEMPARGGNTSLTDEEVRSAVRFMASRAGTLDELSVRSREK